MTDDWPPFTVTMPGDLFFPFQRWLVLSGYIWDSPPDSEDEPFRVVPRDFLVPEEEE